MGLLRSGPAAAYVRSLDDTGTAILFWKKPQATLEMTVPPASFPVAADDLHAAAEAAAKTWSYPSVPCTTVALDISPGFGEGNEVGHDGHNRIIIRTDSWPDDAAHDPSQVALTTMISWHRPGALDDGEIVEADVELNDYHWDFTVVPSDPSLLTKAFLNSYDLQAILTHEFGHVLGLAHDCAMSGDQVRYDDEGRVPPDCLALPADQAAPILASTMYALAQPADTNWRSLSDDDARGVCTLYSRAAEPVEGWCAVAASPVDQGAPLGLLVGTGALAALIVRARRRVSRRPAPTR